MYARLSFWMVGIGLLALVSTGCADKLTRENYDLITVNASDREEVQFLIGPPKRTIGNEWQYENLDKHLNVFIEFMGCEDDDVVKRKQWICPPEWHDTDSPDAKHPSYDETRIRTLEMKVE